MLFGPIPPVNFWAFEFVMSFEVFLEMAVRCYGPTGTTGEFACRAHSKYVIGPAAICTLEVLWVDLAVLDFM